MENQVYFGKGEYAITSANTGKLVAAVKEFTEKGIWKWCLVDCLGIKANGEFTARFAAILAAEGVPAELKEAMIKVKERKAPIVRATGRGSRIATEKKREVVEALKEAGWSEEEIKKVVA